MCGELVLPWLSRASSDKPIALALGDDKGIRITFRDGFGGGAVFGLGIAEKQMIGDVFVVVTALLGQVVGPTEQFEERTDELLLGGSLVYGMKVGGILKKGESLGAEGVEVCGLGQGFLPSGGAEDSVFKKVVGEQLAWHWLVVWESGFLVGSGLRFRSDRDIRPVQLVKETGGPFDSFLQDSSGPVDGALRSRDQARHVGQVLNRSFKPT